MSLAGVHAVRQFLAGVAGDAAHGGSAGLPAAENPSRESLRLDRCVPIFPR
jgi:hypothetical protein